MGVFRMITYGWVHLPTGEIVKAGSRVPRVRPNKAGNVPVGVIARLPTSDARMIDISFGGNVISCRANRYGLKWVRLD